MAESGGTSNVPVLNDTKYLVRTATSSPVTNSIAARVEGIKSGVDSVLEDTKYLTRTGLSSPTAGSMGDLLQGIQASMGLAASGQTWFVAKSGSDSNSGTADAPFLTIQKAHDVASSGDVIVIDSGAYDENVNVEGLKVTKNQLRFLAKSPFQVSITNSNVGHTSTIYINASSVEFQNIYTGGDVLGTGCPTGWYIESGVQLNKIIDCASILHSEYGFVVQGSVNIIQNCFGYINYNATNPVYNFYMPSGNSFFYNCTAMFSQGTSGAGFVIASSNNFLSGCRAYELDTGFNVISGNNNHIEDCKSSNCYTADKLDTGTETGWVNFNTPSLIVTGNTEQQDFKSIWDDTKFIYTTAVDGSAYAGSVADLVLNSLYTANDQYIHSAAIDSPAINSIADNVQYLKTSPISSPTAGTIAGEVQYLNGVALGTPTSGSIGAEVQYLTSKATSSPTSDSIAARVEGIENNTDVLVAGLYLQTGAVWYVDAAVPSSGDGTSPATAFKTIQEGHDACAVGDVVIVASGTYNENANVEGLKITTAGTKFLAKSPFQVTVMNSNGSATSTIYINAQGVQFDNFVTLGDLLYGVCARGWTVDSGATLCKLNACAGYLHSSETFYLAGTYNILTDCIAVLTGTAVTTYAYHIWGGSIIMKQCSASGGELVNAIGLYVDGGNYHQVIDCHMNYYGYGFYADGDLRTAFTNCSALNCGVPWTISSTCNVANCSKSSLITNHNTMQDDLKNIYDKIYSSVGEEGTGASCSGSDGDANRVFTMANTSLSQNTRVYLDGIRMVASQVTIVNQAASSTITFLGNVWDAQTIAVDYEV